MFIQFIIPDIDHYKCFFSAINEHESLAVLNKFFSVAKRVEKLLFHNKIPSWFYYIVLLYLKKNINFDKTDVLAITDLAQKKMPKGFIKWLKTKYPDIRYIMLFYNKVSTLYGYDGNIDMLECPEKDIMLPYDQIFTYDIEESKRLGYEFFVIVSDVSHCINKKRKYNMISNHDVFYCGSIGAEWKLGRYDEVHRVYEYLETHDIDCDFHLVFSHKMSLPDASYVSYNKLSYLDMIERSFSSKVILDVVTNNKSGITPRFYEAMMYNRKYLTNNKTILDHPYYNPQYMKVYENVEDIDLDWICSNEPVDYKYDSRFTPTGFYDAYMQID